MAAWAAAIVVVASQDWRGLALATFDDVWETVRTTYYDPSFGGLDWEAVRREVRPRVEAAPTADQARDEMRAMLGRLGQSHFAILTGAPPTQPTGTASPSIELRILDQAVVITEVLSQSGAARVGLAPGDRVLAIDGMAVESWQPASTDVSDARARSFRWWRAVSDALLGSVDRPVPLRIRRDPGPDRDVLVPREEQPGELVTLGNLPPLRVRTTARRSETPARRTVGVIRFNVWLPAVAAPFALAIDTYRAADGLVIDLRGNPGGLAEMMRGIAGHVLSEPALLGRLKMRDAELEFRANPRRSTPDGRSVEPFSGPVAIVIDELTGSSSECFAGALQSLGRARVFGTTSMGQALPASTRHLPNGDVLLHVVGDFVTSTGRRLEGAGVTPDEEVRVTVSSLVRGSDPPLEAALRWIDAVSGPRPTARP
jgi:carboxyl-terminal processing protease